MSLSLKWRTPLELFSPLDQKVGGFAVDAAADPYDRLVERYYGQGSSWGEDALAVETWLSPAWCNPPYGADLHPFLDKFIQQREQGVSIVALLPAYTSEHWFVEKVRQFADILFLKGRVPFGLPCPDCGGTGTWPRFVDECRGCHGTGVLAKKSQPRFGSCLAVYGPDSLGRVDWFDWKKGTRVTI